MRSLGERKTPLGSANDRIEDLASAGDDRGIRGGMDDVGELPFRKSKGADVAGHEFDRGIGCKMRGLFAKPRCIACEHKGARAET